MADENLTDFLVRLCINDNNLLEKFKKKRTREQVFADEKLLTEDQKQAFIDLNENLMREEIVNNQGAKIAGLAKQANRLAESAAALAKEADALSTSVQSLGDSREKRKKR